MEYIIVQKKNSVDGGLKGLSGRENDYAICLFLQNAELHVNGKQHTPASGSILLLNGDENLYIAANTDCSYEMLCIYFQERYFRKFSEADYDLFAAFQNEKENGKSRGWLDSCIVFKYGLDRKILTMYELYQSDKTEAGIMLLSVLLDILVTVNRACQEQRRFEEQKRENSDSSQKIDEIIRYIKEHLDGRMTLDDLREHFYISKYYLCHEFKRVTGMSCLEYIQRERIEEAKRRLRNGWPIDKVWLCSGYEYYSSFYRVFKKISGKSPKEYLRDIRG